MGCRVMHCLIALAALSLMTAATLAEEPPPDLTGRWLGSGYALSIESQVGRTVQGITTGPNGSAPIYGVIQMDDRAVVFVNKFGNMSGILLSPTSFAFCPDPRPDMKVTGPCYHLGR